jgi:hypothetical protein
MSTAFKEAVYNAMDAFNCTFPQAVKYTREAYPEIQRAKTEAEERAAANAALLAAWTHPEGTAVEYTDDHGVVHSSRTRSKAWALGNGHPVVLLEGRTGGYCLSRVRLAKSEVEGTAA